MNTGVTWLLLRTAVVFAEYDLTTVRPPDCRRCSSSFTEAGVSRRIVRSDCGSTASPCILIRLVGELLIAIEEFGRHLTNYAGRGLGDYADALAAFAGESPDADQSFPLKLDALREARNAAAHVGAAARRTTFQAIGVALNLEDALMNHRELQTAEHYMVEHPVCAEPWQTISMVRNTLLRFQFSALP